MARNRRRTQGGVQWRRNLRNVPARRAAAAAAAAKQPAAVAIPAPPPLPPIRAPPAPPPLPPIRAPPAQVVINGNGARGRARGRAHGRARVVPAGRRPVVAASGRGEKNIDNAFIRHRGRYKIKRFLAVPKNVQVRRRGAVVRQMIARRRAIYPAQRQQREY